MNFYLQCHRPHLDLQRPHLGLHRPHLDLRLQREQREEQVSREVDDQ